MTRKFLLGLGLEADAIDKVLDAAGADLEREKAVSEALREEAKALKAEAAEAKKALKEATDAKTKDEDAFKTKFEAEQTAHEETKKAMKKAIDDETAAHKATKDGIVAEKEAAEVDQLVSEILKRGDDKIGGMNVAAIPKALKLYDRSIVKRGKDGAVENADDVLNHFGREWGDFFAKEEQHGAAVGTPPGNAPKEADPFLAGFDRK